MSSPAFWSDKKKAENLSRELQQKKMFVEKYEHLHTELADLEEIWMMTQDAPEDTSSDEEVVIALRRLNHDVQAFRAKLFLDGPYDAKDAIVSIHAGAGGKDAQDFAQMLFRMYLRYFEKEGFKVNIVDMSEGEDVGLKSVTMEVRGSMVYGVLKGEHGVHRLVRLSPFNVKHTRETSFVLVEVLPDVGLEEVQIDDKDLRVDTFRSSGKGGQSVNTTNSAIRVTHIPTGVVIQCQSERSQLQNKQSAMRVLIAKLTELQKEQKAATISELRGKTRDISWGHQIRSYVLQPYTIVKDHRTNVEVNNVQKVLDGDIDAFIQGYLLSEVHKN